MTRRELALHETMLLLALHDKKGTPSHAMYSYALAGGMLAELVLRERLTIRHEDGKKKKARVELVSDERTGDELLDEALDRVRDAKRGAAPETWVQRFAGTRKLKVRTATALARRGILKEKEEQILLLFRRTVWPTLDPGPERKVVERVRRTVLDGKGDVDARTALVVALLHGTGMLASVFDKAERKASKDRIEALASGDELGGATKAAVDAVVATMAATSAASTAAMIAATS